MRPRTTPKVHPGMALMPPGLHTMAGVPLLMERGGLQALPKHPASRLLAGRLTTRGTLAEHATRIAVRRYVFLPSLPMGNGPSGTGTPRRSSLACRPLGDQSPPRADGVAVVSAKATRRPLSPASSPSAPPLPPMRSPSKILGPALHEEMSPPYVLPGRSARPTGRASGPGEGLAARSSPRAPEKGVLTVRVLAARRCA